MLICSFKPLGLLQPQLEDVLQHSETVLTTLATSMHLKAMCSKATEVHLLVHPLPSWMRYPQVEHICFVVIGAQEQKFSPLTILAMTSCMRQSLSQLVF